MGRGFIAIMLLGLSFLSHARDSQADNDFPRVELTTNMGKIVLELDRRKAPITVANFLSYVVDGEYDNTVFHRVINNFVLQGGGYNNQLKALPTRPAIVNESGNGRSNVLGTIAMARGNPPHSATRQFYINLSDNLNLDPSSRRWGYAVFGEVVSGTEVVEAMGKVATQRNSVLGSPNVPVSPLVLNTARLLPEDE